jgi:hypothetical protein
MVLPSNQRRNWCRRMARRHWLSYSRLNTVVFRIDYKSSNSVVYADSMISNSHPTFRRHCKPHYPNTCQHKHTSSGLISQTDAFFSRTSMYRYSNSRQPLLICVYIPTCNSVTLVAQMEDFTILEGNTSFCGVGGVLSFQSVGVMVSAPHARCKPEIRRAKHEIPDYFLN